MRRKMQSEELQQQDKVEINYYVRFIPREVNGKCKCLLIVCMFISPIVPRSVHIVTSTQWPMLIRDSPTIALH